MTFYSSRYYENIEEWFFEDEIYNQWTQVAGNTGAAVGGSNILFRRGNNYSYGSSANGINVHDFSQGYAATAQTMAYPMRMIIRGWNTADGCQQNKFTVNFYVTQVENPVIAR